METVERVDRERVAFARRVSYRPVHVRSHRDPVLRPRDVLLAVTALACGCRNPVAPVRSDAPPVAEPTPGFQPHAPVVSHDASPGFVDQQLAMRATTTANLRPVGTPLRGVLGEGATGEHGFDVMAGHCYRVLGASGVEAEDIELTLLAPDGSEIDADTHGGSAPVLGATRPLCPPVSGRYVVRVRMAHGQGDYGLQVMATP